MKKIIFGQKRLKKILSHIALVTLLVNILAPGLTYAALPNYSNNLAVPNVYAVAQINEITLPRALVIGDNLSLTISGTTVSQSFDTDSLTTASLFNTKIDLLSEVSSIYDDANKKFTITSSNPGAPFTISNLTITRTPIVPNTTVANVVAVAQVSEINIPQQLFAGDTINFSINGTPLTQTFSGSKDSTLQDFADLITSSTTASGVYDSANSKIIMTAKIAGTSFSMSNLIITSNGIAPTNIQSNIVPVKQVDNISFPRAIYSDETISITISGTTVNQPYNTDYNTTLNNLSLQLDSLSDIDSTYSAGTITITSANAGIPFGTGNINITGGIINAVNITPNVLAEKQKDVIAVPRNLFMGDVINFNLGVFSATQGFTSDTNTTILALMTKIDLIPGVVTTNYNPVTRLIEITAEDAGTPFVDPSLYITSSFNSSNQVANITAQNQITRYNFPRALVAGDNISAVINGSPFNNTFSGTSNETIDAFANNIHTSLSGTITSSTGSLSIDLSANIAGISFTAGPLQITNTLTPQVIVANVVPTKQRNILTLGQTLLSGDTISISIDGNNISQAYNSDENNTLTLFNSQINSLTGVNSSLDLGNKTFTIDAAIAGTGFTISSAQTTGSNITSSGITANVNEINSELSLNIIGVPADTESIKVGDCDIDFISGGAWDLDCSGDNSATINIDAMTNTALSSILGSIDGITDSPIAGIRNINSSSSGSIVTFKNISPEISTSNIVFNNNTIGGVININSQTPGQIAQIQSETLTLPRDFNSGDTFQTVINGITVTQNFLSNSGVSFNNLVNQIDSLPDISATGSNNVITITADSAGTPFTITSANFSNITNSTLTISNVIAVAQKDTINFPTNLVTNDQVSISIDSNIITQNFNTDSNTTLSNLATQITNNTAVNASLSGSLGLVLEAKVAGTPFDINFLKVENITNPTNIQNNVVGIKQVDSLSILYSVSSGDSMNVNISGTSVSQNFTTDIFTTLSSLNTLIDSNTSVNSSVNTDSGIFTLTAKTAGVPFTASFFNTGATINSTNTVPNVDSGAQVDTLVVNREIKSGDSLSLSIANSTLNQIFTTDKATTLANLNTQIDSLSEIISSFDGNETFTITSSIPGIAFTGGILNISTNYNSVNQVANVPAQTQIDKITLPRNIITGDSLSIDVDGNIVTDSFSGDMITTMNSFANKINLAQSGTTASISGNDITFTANTAGTPFTIGTGSFVLTNNTLVTTTTPNVTAVAQQDEFVIPTLVSGDTVFMSVNGKNIVESYNSDSSITINNLINNINSTATEVTSSYVSGSGNINITSNTAGLPFSTSNVSIINTTPAIETVANVVPVAQVVNMYPSGTIREGVTFRTTINGNDYDYLTLPGDNIPEVVAGILASVSNSGITVSTGSDITGEFVSFTSVTAGVPFTYDSNAIDITAPIITTPINGVETLRSGITSTSNVQINEDGDIYLVLSGTTINNSSDIATALAGGEAFIGKSNALSHIPYTITVANGVTDGMYNFVAVDPYNNISQAVPGWLIVDNTAPIVNITTPTQTTNSNTINISGTTEANTPVNISGGVGIINTMSDGVGAWSGTVTLNLDTTNTILVNATDIAGNIGSGSVIIISDTLTPNPFTLNYPNYTNSSGANVDINTESGILAEVYSGVTLVNSGITDGSGNISLNVSLDINTANNFHVVATDAGGNTNSGNVVIIQDSINPTVILDSLPSIMHGSTVVINGITEPNSNVMIENSGTFLSTTADNGGSFSAVAPIFPNSTNTILVTATDLAGNIGTGSVSTYEDSIPNTLIISTPSFFTNNSSITVTGSTKIGSTITITGGLLDVTGSVDGAGNFTANIDLISNFANVLNITSVDQVGNIMTGSITVTHDNINPTVNITTPATPTNNTTINLIGTTEGNSQITISGGSGSVSGVSDGSGNFNIPTPLNIGTANNLTITVTDQAGNIGNGTFNIIQDPIINFLNVNANSIIYTNSPTYFLTGSTKPNADITITGGSGNLSLTADSIGDFSGTINLNSNTGNLINISSTDNTLTTVNTGITIIHDDINPIINLAQTGTISTNQANYVIIGNTESGANLQFSNGTSTIVGQTDSLGNFSITFPLNLNTTNNITGVATDLAGNISSTVSLNIIHDNQGPVIGGVVINQVVSGISMNAFYSFNTNENSTSTMIIGTGSNVDSTLVFSGTTVGLTHSGVAVGLTPNTIYYYYINSVDSIGNNTQSPIATINSIDNTGPTISYTQISNITISGATLNFGYSDNYFNSGTLATGSIIISDGITSQNLSPNLNYGIGNLTGDIQFNSLNSGTNYNYTLSLVDDFGNSTSASGSFLTSQNIILTGGTITSTGSITIPTGTGNTTDLSGTTLIINSDPITSGINTGSITIPGGVTIVSGTGWDGTITAPTLINPTSPQAATNQEVATLISNLNNSTTTYTPNVIQTIFVGGNTTLVASGGLFSITTSFASNMIGQTLYIFRSQDGNSWVNNTPTLTCLVNNSNVCTFTTDTLGYFSFVSAVGTPVIIPPTTPVHSGGGGGGGLSKDYCPSGDFSPSYYDGICGTNPSSNTGSITSSGTNLPEITSSGTTVTQSQIEQVANKFILQVKQNNYPTAITLEQKIDLWNKIAQDIKAKMKVQNISTVKKDLYNNLLNKVQNIIDSLVKQKEIPTKIIDQTTNQNNDIQSSEEKNIEETFSYYQYIDVANSIVIRNAPSYKGNIDSYLPRNYKVEVLEYGNLWSKIKYQGDKIGYIRSKFLRSENEHDRARNASIMVFWDVSLQAGLDMRKVNVLRALNVRRGPGVDYDIKTTITKGEKVLILDEPVNNGWYEIRWSKGTGWVNGKYLTPKK